ncbi:MAG TPA: hypothetical protein VF473_03045 [Cyclobacteriaceae bacterium]
MVRKFFPLDKNYLLEEAQLELKGTLLSCLVGMVKEEYEHRYNPLGICDEFIHKVRDYEADDLKALENFYHTLAGVYRYKFGDNQLQFMWDGGDQLQTYKKEWSAFFADQTKSFCKNELFIKAVLDLTVFNNYSQLSENRMNNFMLHSFEVKLQKGFIKVA